MLKIDSKKSPLATQLNGFACKRAVHVKTTVIKVDFFKAFFRGKLPPPQPKKY